MKGTNVHVKMFSKFFFWLKIVGKMDFFKPSVQILDVIKIYLLKFMTRLCYNF